jgi:predicted AAA+ superfamily ATPase
MWIQRLEENKITEWLSQSNKGVILIGARQIGKSSLLKKIAPTDSIVINYASPRTLNEHRISLEAFRDELIAAVRERTSKTPLTVIVDEAPRNPEIFNLAQELMDEYPIRFILTGSSARRLQSGTFNRLPGRVALREMWPLALLESFPDKLDERLIWGMLPEIVTNPKIRGELLGSYVGLYIREEIEQENLVRSPDIFSRFLKLAAGESGGLINAAKLAKQLGNSLKSVLRFYEILAATRVAFYLPPFVAGNLRQEVIRTPKFYLFDNGVRNAAAGRPLTLSLLDLEGGLLFEHLLIQEAFKIVAALSSPENPVSIYYWREHNGKEIDLVLERGDGTLALFEFKFTRDLSEKHTAPFHLFASRYSKKISTRMLVAPVSRSRQLDGINIVSPKKYVETLKEWVLKPC